MIRLPYFRYHAPSSLDEAVRILADEGPQAMLIAGGTDLLPNMKRRQQAPQVLVALRNIHALKIARNGSGLTLGAGLTLTDIVRNDTVKKDYAGLWQAVIQIATPHLRNMGTLGGNLCLDTRCSYYNQSYEWRKAIDFCMKKDGEVCWVAPGSKRCLAISSTDTAPALVALGAKVRLVSADDERTLSLAKLYQDDGIDFLRRRPDEILTEVLLPPLKGWRSTYWKLRRRGSFDFPVLSVAAAVRLNNEKRVEEARIVLGAVSSQPVVCEEVAKFITGSALSDDVIQEAGKLAAKVARPVKNADFAPRWRKRVATRFVGYALQELRGDDTRELRRRFTRYELS